MFKGTNQPWRLGAFFGDEKFAVHKNWTGCMRELEGACNQNSMAADTSITKELTNNLYNRTFKFMLFLHHQLKYAEP